MRTLEIKKATKALADYAREVDRGAVLILRNGKPLAVLSTARGMDAESISLANDSRFASIIEKSRATQHVEGGLSVAEVRRKLQLTRGRSERK